MFIYFKACDLSSQCCGPHGRYSETSLPQPIVLAENKKSGVLKLFCASQKAIVLPRWEWTAYSEREGIDLSFTVSQQELTVVEHLKRHFNPRKASGVRELEAVGCLLCLCVE